MDVSKKKTTRDAEVMLVETVTDNEKMYTPRDRKRALEARKLQHTLAGADANHLKQLLNKKLIKNCDLTSDDVRAAEHIYGGDLVSLKGKTARKKGIRVYSSRVTIPPNILTRYQAVTLCIDIMKVNQLPFFVTVSRNLDMTTGEFITNMKEKTCLLYTSDAADE